MISKEILKKLQELYSMREVKEGFPTQQACIDWSNKVAPLLKFSEQYYYNFMQNAHKMNLPLSSYTLEPAFNVMKSQVQMAIEELKLLVEENNKAPVARSKEPMATIADTCGPLAKERCDIGKEIAQEYSDNNIFLDIPYQNYEDCEKILRDMLTQFGFKAVVAKDRLTSNAVLCKVCNLIRTCKYGIVDISSGSNSVSYEYGVMHGPFF